MADVDRYRIEITPQGSLRLDADVARRLFPTDSLVALVRGPELWLLPIRESSAGGLMLKQRNPRGDRSVLLHGCVDVDLSTGVHDAFWDPGSGALRVALAGP